MDKRNNDRAGLNQVASVFEDNEIVRDASGRAIIRKANSQWNTAREEAKPESKLGGVVETSQIKSRLGKPKQFISLSSAERPFEEKEIRMIAIEDRKTKLVLFGLLGLILVLVAVQAFNINFREAVETGNPLIKHAIVYDTLEEYWGDCNALEIDIYHRADCELKILSPPAAPSE